MAVDLDFHLRRLERLIGERKNFDSLYQEAAEFIFPNKSVVNELKTPGQDMMVRVFDSTAIWANQLLASALQGTLTSPDYPWFTLRMRDEEANDDPEISEWLEECQRRMYLAFRQSNFNAELYEVYLDLGAFGMSALLLEERPKRGPGFGGFVFKVLALGSYVIAENAEGIVDTVYRTLTMNARQCVQRFGVAAVGDRIRDTYEKEPDTPVEVVHCVYPRADYDPARYTGRAKAIASVWIARQEKYLLHEGGYDDPPLMVPRWSKTPGESYGRGPGLTALPDVKTLNRTIELWLRNGGKQIDPPMQIPHDGVYGDVDLRAGGTTTVEPGAEIKPVAIGGNLDFAQMLDGRLSQQILRMFYYDQLQLQGGPAMTATEVERRVEQMQRLLGPTIARLHPELLKPVIDRGFGLMLRAGALPPIPEALMDYEGADIDIEYEGPLAKAQRSSQVTALEQWIALAAPLASVKPEVLDVIDLDVALRAAGRIRGLPTSWFRAPKKTAGIRQARLQAQQQEAQMAQVSQIAESAGKAAPALQAMNDMRQTGQPAAA